MAVGAEVNTAVAGRNRREVDLRVEFYSRGLSRVIFAASDAEEVDAAVEHCAGRSYNRAIPVGEGLIVRVVETVGA